MFRIQRIGAVRTLLRHKSLSTTTTVPPVPVVELQEFQINPAHVWKYIQYAKSQSALRRQLLPLRLFALPEIGGILNIASHFYYYKNGIEEQQSVRKATFENPAWQQFLMESRVWQLEQRASLYVEAPLVQSNRLKGMKTGHVKPLNPPFRLSSHPTSQPP